MSSLERPCNSTPLIQDRNWDGYWNTSIKTWSHKCQWCLNDITECANIEAFGIWEKKIKKKCMYFGIACTLVPRKLKSQLTFSTLWSVNHKPHLQKFIAVKLAKWDLSFSGPVPPPAPLEFWEFFWVGGREREIEGLGLFFLNVSKKKNYQRSCLERWLTDLQTIKAYSGGEKRKLWYCNVILYSWSSDS